MNALAEYTIPGFAPAELEHDPTRDTVTVEFTRQFLSQFMEWCNAAKIRDDHGNVLTLGVREFTDGKAAFWVSVHTPEKEE